MSRYPFVIAFLSLTRAVLIPVSTAAAGEIHELIKDGKIEQAKVLLLENSKLIEERDEDKQTPLHVAAHRGQVAMVKFLLERGANVNARAYNEFTPLRLAEEPAIVKLLIEHKADLEAKDVSNSSVLEDAAERCARGDLCKEIDMPWKKKVKLLLDAGAYYDIRSATYLADLDRVRVLLKEDRKAARRRGLMMIAACHGRTAIVKLLLEHGADPVDANWNGLPLLYFALPYPEIVRLLLDAGADPKFPLKSIGGGALPEPEDKVTLLHLAAAKGHVETAKLFLDAGVPVDVRTAANETPLFFAASRGRPEMVKLLLEKKASIQGDDGRRAISEAARRIYSEEKKEDREKNVRFKAVIEILHAQGVPIDFFTAIALSKTERVKELLKEKPTLARSKDEEVRFDQLALHRAVNLDHKEIVALLLDAGAPINDKDERGNTALHFAAFRGRAEMVKLLIDHKADVNATASGGFTPLHETAHLQDPAVAKLLLAAGARVNAKDENGRTPLSWAKHPEMIQLLREHGGTK